MDHSDNPIANNIKRLRQEQGLSASELARQANISKAYLSQLESGKFSSPSVDILFKLAGALGVTIADLTDKETFTQEVSKIVPIPPSLQEAMKIYSQLKPHAEMLAGIKFRGKYPTSPEDWLALFTLIKNTIQRDGKDQ